MGAVLVVLSGSAALDALESNAQSERIEQSLQDVKTDFDTAQYASTSDPLSLSHLDGSYSVENRGELRFQINPDLSVRNGIDPAGKCTAEIELESLVYEEDGHEFTYQAGGIFTTADEASRVVASPGLTYDTVEKNGRELWTIDFPVLGVANSSELDDRTAAYDVEESAERRQQLHDDLCLPPRDHDDISQVTGIRIEVDDSPYADAWLHFFEDEFPTDHEQVDVWMDGNTVVAQAPLGPEDSSVDPESFNVDLRGVEAEIGAVHHTASDKIHFQNTDIFSYDSSVGPFGDASQVTDEAQIFAAGDIRFPPSNNNIHGQLIAGGDISHADEGDIEDADIDLPTEITDHVEFYIDAAETAYGDGTAHNDDTDAVDGTSLESGDQTLETGVYYLESATVESGDELVLDTTDGDVVLAIDGDLEIGNDVTITVEGEHDVRWLVDDDIEIGESVTFDVGDHGQRTTQNMFFGADGTETTIDRGTTFVGVVYTPQNEITVAGGTGNELTKSYGSLIGDITFGTGAPNAEYYHDRAIDDLFSSGIEGGDGVVSGPGYGPFDVEVTLVDAEFARVTEVPWDPHTEWHLPVPEEALETVANPDGDLEELEYWQTASSTADDTVNERPILQPHVVATTCASEDSGDDDPAPPAESIPGPTDGIGFGVSTGTTSGCDHPQIWFHGQAGEQVSIAASAHDHQEPPENATLNLYRIDWVNESNQWTLIKTDQGTLDHTLSAGSHYVIEVQTPDGKYYRVEGNATVSDGQYVYEDVSFDANRHDRAKIDVDSPDVDPSEAYVTFYDPDDEPVSVHNAVHSNSWSRGHDVQHNGEYTARVISYQPDAFDYDIALERTHLWGVQQYVQTPIEASLIFEDEDGTVDRYEPWPEMTLDDVSGEDAGWDGDINHPAVEYPQSATYEDLPAGANFSVELTYRTQECVGSASYAGTSRTHDGTEYHEVGCSSNDDEHGTINVIEDEDSSRIKILADGDQVPDIEGSEAQRNTQEMLGEKVEVDADGTPRMNLSEGEFAVVFDLGEDPDDPDWEPTWEEAIDSGAEPPDYNDVIILYEITDIHEAETGNGEGGNGESGKLGDPSTGQTDYSVTISIDNGVITVGE